MVDLVVIVKEGAFDHGTVLRDRGRERGNESEMGTGDVVIEEGVDAHLYSGGKRADEVRVYKADDCNGRECC